MTAPPSPPSPPPRGPLARAAARIAAMRPDVTPWRESRDFRLLLVSGAVFYLGFMVTNVALAYQLFHLTGSNFAVGALGLAELLPLVFGGLYGGALADHVDRRTMLIACGLGQLLIVAGLLANSLAAHPQVWLVYVLGALAAITHSLQRPSRDALNQQVVAHEQMTAAVTLTSLSAQVGLLLGPAIGGLLVAGPGLPFAFGVEVVGLGVATLLYLRLQRRPRPEGGARPSLAGIAEGVRYAAGRRDLLGTYVIDLVAMVMAMSTAVYPAFATRVLDRPQVLGLLYTVETLGGFVAAMTSGWTARVHRHGRAIAVAAAAWGLAIACAGLAQPVWLVLACLFVAGMADEMSGIFRGTIWNQTIPQGMRGRLAGIELLSYSLGPVAGQARAGLVADAFGVRTAIVSGGVLCVAGVGAVTAALRGLWSYDDRTDENAARERTARTAGTAGTAVG